jgi:hypothetical protein
VSIKQEFKIPRPLSEAIASNHSNVFTFALPLSEGQMGEAWEPSNKMMQFLNFSQNKFSRFSLFTFHSHLLFCYAFSSHLSLTKSEIYHEEERRFEIQE